MGIAFVCFELIIARKSFLRFNSASISFVPFIREYGRFFASLPCIFENFSIGAFLHVPLISSLYGNPQCLRNLFIGTFFRPRAFAVSMYVPYAILYVRRSV